MASMNDHLIRDERKQEKKLKLPKIDVAPFMNVSRLQSQKNAIRQSSAFSVVSHSSKKHSFESAGSVSGIEKFQKMKPKRRDSGQFKNPFKIPQSAQHKKEIEPPKLFFDAGNRTPKKSTRRESKDSVLMSNFMRKGTNHILKRNGKSGDRSFSVLTKQSDYRHRDSTVSQLPQRPKFQRYMTGFQEQQQSNHDDQQAGSLHNEGSPSTTNKTMTNPKKSMFQANLDSITSSDFESSRENESFTGDEKAQFRHKRTRRLTKTALIPNVQDLAETAFQIPEDTFLKKDKWLIDPNNIWKFRWDLYIVALLLFISFVVPYRLAFAENEILAWHIINGIVDVSFLIDMIMTFFTIYFDEKKMITVADKKTIAKNYLKTWFFIDLFTILPIEFIIVGSGNNGNDFTSLARFSRIGKLYKLIKMTRLVKMLRLYKDRRKIVSNLDKVLKISAGFERLTFFYLFFAIFCHMVTCLWIVVAYFNDKNWIVEMQSRELLSDYPTEFDLYSYAFYFVMSTVTTVGYGDISPVNVYERTFGVFLMIIGVVAFSFASGSLSSIISNYDSSQATAQEKLLLLNKIKKQYAISNSLYNELRVAIKYEYSKNIDGLGQFMESLPHKLRIAMASEIHKDICETFEFFRNVKEKTLLPWIGHRLVPRLMVDKQYLYQETDDIDEIYFIQQGSIAFVLPKYNNAFYKRVTTGAYIGLEDVIYNMSEQAGQDKQSNELGVRKFSTMTITPCELLLIKMPDLFKMQIDFPIATETLFNESSQQCEHLLELRVEFTNKIEQDLEDTPENLGQSGFSEAVKMVNRKLFKQNRLSEIESKGSQFEQDSSEPNSKQSSQDEKVSDSEDTPYSATTKQKEEDGEDMSPEDKRKAVMKMAIMRQQSRMFEPTNLDQIVESDKSSSMSSHQSAFDSNVDSSKNNHFKEDSSGGSGSSANIWNTPSDSEEGKEEKQEIPGKAKVNTYYEDKPRKSKTVNEKMKFKRKKKKKSHEEKKSDSSTPRVSKGTPKPVITLSPIGDDQEKSKSPEPRRQSYQSSIVAGLKLLKAEADKRKAQSADKKETGEQKLGDVIKRNPPLQRKSITKTELHKVFSDDRRVSSRSSLHLSVQQSKDQKLSKGLTLTEKVQKGIEQQLAQVSDDLKVMNMLKSRKERSILDYTSMGKMSQKDDEIPQMFAFGKQQRETSNDQNIMKMLEKNFSRLEGMVNEVKFGMSGLQEEVNTLKTSLKRQK